MLVKQLNSHGHDQRDRSLLGAILPSPLEGWWRAFFTLEPIFGMAALLGDRHYICMCGKQVSMYFFGPVAK